jgi:hypothetical protein
MTLDEQYRRMMMEAKGTDPDQKFRCWFGAKIKVPHTKASRSSESEENRRRNDEWMSLQVAKALGRSLNDVVSETEAEQYWDPMNNDFGGIELDDEACVISEDENAGVAFEGDMADIKKVLDWLKDNSKGFTSYWVTISSGRSLNIVNLALLNKRWDEIIQALDDGSNRDNMNYWRDCFVEALETGQIDEITDILYTDEMADFAFRGFDNAEVLDLNDKDIKFIRDDNGVSSLGIKGEKCTPSNLFAMIKKMSSIAKDSVTQDTSKEWASLGKYIVKNVPCKFPNFDVFRYVTLGGDADSIERQVEDAYKKLTGNNTVIPTDDAEQEKPSSEIVTKKDIPSDQDDAELKIDIDDTDIADDSEKLSESIRRMRELAGILKG